MPRLIDEILLDVVGRAIVDKTDFTGVFDFKLEFAPGESAQPGNGPLADAGSPTPANLSGPSVFTALQEQPGLQLKPAKGPVEVIVIDRVERPSEN